MEIEYERTLTGSYMKISAVDNPGFDEKIMLKNRIPGFLRVEKSHVDGKGQYWYEISGYQSLAGVCSLKKIDINFIEKIILTLCDQLDAMERNLLDSNYLFLDPDTVFVSNMDESIRYIIFPESYDSIAVCFRDLMEFLLTKLDHSSKDDVQFAYEIYEKTLDSEYNIRNIRDIIIMRRKEEAKRQIDLKSIVSLQSDNESQQNAIDTENDGASYDNKEKADAPKKENNKFNSIIEKIVNIIGEYLGIDIGKLCKRKSRENDKDDRERHRSTKREKKKKSKYNKKKQREELIVQPDVPEESDTQYIKHEEPVFREVHPTVCLSDYREHPQGMLLYEGYEGLNNIALKSDETRIGQASETDVVIDKPTISRFHACILREEGEFFLMDMNSSNGTYVNNKPIAYKEKYQLKINDIIRFADIKYRFV